MINVKQEVLFFTSREPEDTICSGGRVRNDTYFSVPVGEQPSDSEALIHTVSRSCYMINTHIFYVYTQPVIVPSSGSSPPIRFTSALPLTHTHTSCKAFAKTEEITYICHDFLSSCVLTGEKQAPCSFFTPSLLLLMSFLSFFIFLCC